MKGLLHANAPARIMRAGEVSNLELVDEIYRSAQEACDLVAWPDGIPYSRAVVAVHQYLRDHTEYVEDLDEQVIKFPRALVVEGVGDCKSSAIFAASMLRAAGCAVVLRFIAQPSRPWWSHVYVVADGIPCDPLLPLGAEADRSAVLDLYIQ